jgi:ABC-2 type transport system ATP-binding protein
VEAACTRAIIIDRGQIVANGTPAELKQRSEAAGAVSVRIPGVYGSLVSHKLGQLPSARRVVVVKEEPGAAVVRVFPQPRCGDGELARSIAEATVREGWKLEELHTEEGRLDEVFRNITMPETGQEKQS